MNIKRDFINDISRWVLLLIVSIIFSVAFSSNHVFASSKSEKTQKLEALLASKETEQETDVKEDSSINEKRSLVDRLDQCEIQLGRKNSSESTVDRVQALENELGISNKERSMVERIEIIEQELGIASDSKSLEEFEKDISNDKTDNSEEMIYQAVIDAYWKLYHSAKVPDSVRFFSIKIYNGKIVYSYVAEENDGSHIEYTSLYDPETQESKGLGHKGDVDDCYMDAEDLNVEEILSFNESNNNRNDRIPVEKFISAEEAEEYLTEYEKEETTLETEETTPDTEEEIVDHDIVEAVQTMLNVVGYDCGVADGKIGNKTIAAINAFQKDHGLAVTGKVTYELIDFLSEYKTESDNDTELVSDNDIIASSMKTKISSDYQMSLLSSENGVDGYVIINDTEKYLFIINSHPNNGSNMTVGLMLNSIKDIETTKLATNCWSLVSCMLMSIDTSISAETAFTLIDSACADGRADNNGYALLYDGDSMLFTVEY